MRSNTIMCFFIILSYMIPEEGVLLLLLVAEGGWEYNIKK